MRKVRESSTSIPTLEGAGVHLRRAFGFQQPERYDPFLLFDDFRSDTPAHYEKGFPWHPHRGIETITYVLAGDVEHGDSLGNSGIISGGDVQWMTAGSGIVHQEMPKGDDKGAMHGFQLWLNLPAAEKMCDPSYRDITADQIPVVKKEDGTVIRIISGRCGDICGPVTGISMDPHYFDISLPANTVYRESINAGYTVIVYVIGGSAGFGEDEKDVYTDRSLLLFDKGEQFAASAGTEGCRFLLLAGKPLKEPIAWQGPIVMNTQEQLAQAFQEYRTGTFLRQTTAPKQDSD